MKKMLVMFSMLMANVYCGKMFIAVIENNTVDGYYRFSSKQFAQNFLLAPLSAKFDLDFTEVTEDTLYLNAVKGTNPSIFIRKGKGCVSGDCGGIDIVPYYLEVWTEDPSATSFEKQYVRYCAKSTPALGDRAYFGLRIQGDGSPRFFEMDGGSVTFLDSDFVVEQQQEEVDSELPETQPFVEKEQIEQEQQTTNESDVSSEEPIISTQEPTESQEQESEPVEMPEVVASENAAATETTETKELA